MTINIMMSTRRPTTLNFTAPLVLDPPRHCGLSSIALVPGRHMIGTAAGCGIRLQVDGILDRHALILVGENRTIVKSMDSRTWVNDSPVSEMALRPGDRLSIGPLTFRVRLATRDEQAAFAVIPTAQEEEGDIIAVPPHFDSPVTVTPMAQEKEGGGVGQASNLSVQTPSPPEPGPANLSNQSLDSRLDEIEQRLADLRQSTLSIVQPVQPQPANTESNARTPHPFRQWHDELQCRAEQIAAETQHLHERVESVADREAQVERRQQQLVLEAERIADAARTTELNLAEEHARHVSVRQEWEASYQKMTGDLATQLDAIERQQESLQSEADRLAVARMELQRALADHEQDERVFATEQVNLANARTEFAAVESQYDAKIRHLQREADERQAQFEADRREFVLRELSLSNLQAEVESERQALMADRSALEAWIEQEHQRLASLQTRLDDDRRQLLEEREEQRTQSELRASLEDDRRQRARFPEKPATVATVAVIDSLPPDQVTWNCESSGEINTPLPVTPYAENPGEFGVAVDWGALAAVDQEFGRPTVSESARNITARLEPGTGNHWENAPGYADYSLTTSPAFQASTLEVAQAPDDPWARFAPAGFAVPESRSLAPLENNGETTDSRNRSDQSLSEHEPGTLANMVADFASQFASQEDDRPVEASQNPSANETLADVNREFGVAVSEPLANPATTAALPSWWLENPQGTPEQQQPDEIQQPGRVVEALNSGMSEVPEATASQGNDLRAQLAMLFDLPGAATIEAANPDAMETCEVKQNTSDVATGSMIHPNDGTFEVDSSPVAASEESDTRVEDSVESFMAKLLARSRTGASEMSTPDSQRGASETAVRVADSTVPTVSAVPSEQDRSHLMAEPKHKQDKQAVRENLQSFRQVAHLSARSALAKHSLRQLRNATIAKGVLLGAATISAAWFFAEPLWGGPLQLWKAAGCSLAGLLSAMEFGRSWKQLHKPLQGAAPARATSTPDSPATGTDQSVVAQAVEPVVDGQQAPSAL